MHLINTNWQKSQNRYIVDPRFINRLLDLPAKSQELGLQRVGCRIDRSQGFALLQNVTLPGPRHPTPE